MNVIQMFAVPIVAVVLSTIHQFASVCQNTKAIHRPYHVNHQKMHAQYQLVDQILNVHVLPMELQNVHVYRVSLKARTQFVAVLNRRAPVNRSHADLVLLVMFLEVKFAIVLKEPLVIHSNNVHHHLSSKNFANQVPVEVSLHENLI